uniref:Eukaryotic translation initiation factor 4E n=1 Tax=Ditylum brightwellii TaxID=49249 RepID=A0A6S8Z3Y7_9STRA|mmetsp:Transcript_35555/g.47716  ORF Transcript_35555/g.47716 Transcript_35555/m.47716 type:complete len:195 (-) Transcript_35555:276-860(-)
MRNAEWVLWEHAGGAKRDPNAWKENMKQLCKFKTIEDFWRYFNHIPKPSDVFYDGETRKRVGPEGKSVEEYSLFKSGIEPEWGDPANRTGGEWYFRQHLEGDVLNMYWQNLVLGVVGETIESEADDGSMRNHINGARVVDKGRPSYPMFRLELWINTKDPEIKERIRVKLVEAMVDGLPPNRRGQLKFDWKDHS